MWQCCCVAYLRLRGLRIVVDGSGKFVKVGGGRVFVFIFKISAKFLRSSSCDHHLADLRKVCNTFDFNCFSAQSEIYCVFWKL